MLPRGGHGWSQPTLATLSLPLPVSEGTTDSSMRRSWAPCFKQQYSRHLSPELPVHFVLFTVNIQWGGN